VSIQAGGNVLIIRAPRSYTAPHRVIRDGGRRFWARSAAGKYEPDVNELRTLFNAGPQLADRIRNFRLDRIAKIAVGDTPVQTMKRGTLIIHIVPLSAFDTIAALPLQEIQRNFSSFVPLGSRTAQAARINFDGVLKTSNADAQATENRAYAQLFRNGIIETLTSTMLPSNDSGIIANFDDSLIYEIMRNLRDLAAVGVEPPYALLVSLIGVAGARFNTARSPGHNWAGDYSEILDRDQYHFDEVIFETLPTNEAECAGVMRPVLDQIANAGGNAKSRIFDDQGNYIAVASQR